MSGFPSSAANWLRSLPHSANSSLKYYVSNSAQLRTEVLSGVSIGVMAVPQAVAFSFLAGMPPMTGLWASALLPIVVGSLTGRAGSISAAAGATAALIKTLTDESGPLSHLPLIERQQFLAPVLLVSCGLQVFCGLIQASKFMKLIPSVVMMGFMNALSIVIARGQFECFQYCATGPYETCTESMRSWLSFSTTEVWLTIIHVLLAIACMLFWQRVPKVGKIVPGTFVALIITTVLEEAIFRRAIGASTRNVGETTNLTNSFPTYRAPVFPAGASSSDVGTLIQFGATITAINLIESILAINIMCRMLKVPVTTREGNQECFAQAAGSLVCALFQAQGGGVVVGPCMINLLNGARGKCSAIVSGLFMLLIVGLAHEAIAIVPIAGLSGILLGMSIFTFDWTTFHTLLYAKNSDRFILLFVSVVGCVWDLAFAVLIGCGLAALVFTYEHSNLLQVEKKEIREEEAENQQQTKADFLLTDTNRSVAISTDPDAIADGSSIQVEVASSNETDLPSWRIYRVSGPLCYTNIADYIKVFQWPPALHAAHEPVASTTGPLYNVVVDFRNGARICDHSTLVELKEWVKNVRAAMKGYRFRLYVLGLEAACGYVSNYEKFLNVTKYFDDFSLLVQQQQGEGILDDVTRAFLQQQLNITFDGRSSSLSPSHHSHGHLTNHDPSFRIEPSHCEEERETEIEMSVRFHLG